MASMSSYLLPLWLWVNWETPTPSIFTVIVAGAVWAHEKLCSQLQNQLHKDKRRKQPKIQENVSFVALYFLQKIYSGNSATQYWFVIKLERVIYPTCICSKDNYTSSSTLLLQLQFVPLMYYHHIQVTEISSQFSENKYLEIFEKAHMVI